MRGHSVGKRPMLKSSKQNYCKLYHTTECKIKYNKLWMGQIHKKMIKTCGDLTHTYNKKYIF